jgi:hypothetical protein
MPSAVDTRPIANPLVEFQGPVSQPPGLLFWRPQTRGRDLARPISATGPIRPGRGKAWLIRKLGELENAGSNPAALIP